MPYTTLSLGTAGQVYTAAAHNAIVNNLNALGPAAFNVQSTAKTDTFTMSTTNFTDVTGLSVSITPSSASSKILIDVNLFMGAQVAVTNVFARLVRGSTTIAVGDAAGTRIPVTIFGSAAAANPMGSMVFLDSPATTSSVTYKIQIRAQSANTIAINRDVTDSDSTATARGISTITAIEVPV
jgi:hypothetical protein